MNVLFLVNECVWFLSIGKLEAEVYRNITEYPRSLGNMFEYCKTPLSNFKTQVDCHSVPLL
jgi:hypothetical protein